MEFPFAVNNYLQNEITKLTNTLIPNDFSGDRRTVLECVTKISDILDEMGEASAKAQYLKRPITSSEKMRNCDHDIYFLVDKDGNEGDGTVVGLLKVGWKELYLYDAHGKNHKMRALCVLDFYIHESKQRMGCGKYLYEFMLKDQNVKPQHLAVDRPSDKFIGFLHKHYGLEMIIPQANNYVVFNEFFTRDGAEQNGTNSSPKILESFASLELCKRQSYNGLQQQTQQMVGRHAAHKHGSTMGKILQSSVVETSSRNSSTPASGRSSLNGSRSTSPDRSSNHALQDQVPKSLFLHSNLW